MTFKRINMKLHKLEEIFGYCLPFVSVLKKGSNGFNQKIFWVIGCHIVPTVGEING